MHINKQPASYSTIEITDTWGLPPLIPLLGHPEEIVQRHAVQMMTSFLNGMGNPCSYLVADIVSNLLTIFFPASFVAEKNYPKLKEYMEERGGLQALVCILYSPIESIQEKALTALISITQHSGLIMHSLVPLLPSSYACCTTEEHERDRSQSIIFAGGLPPLIALLSSSSLNLSGQSLQALAKITGNIQRNHATCFALYSLTTNFILNFANDQMIPRQHCTQEAWGQSFICLIQVLRKKVHHLY